MSGARGEMTTLVRLHDGGFMPYLAMLIVLLKIGRAHV